LVLPSASSGDLLSFGFLGLGRNNLLEVLVLLTAVILTNPGLDFRGRQQPFRLGNRLLAMQPARFDRVQPGALRKLFTITWTYCHFDRGMRL
jgi:hypothetical protein